MMSPREKRLHRIEQRNDRTLIGTLALCTGAGFFFGAMTGGAAPAIGLGLLGALIGIPAGADCRRDVGVGREGD